MLAYDWLQSRLSKEPIELWGYEKTFEAAVSALDIDARRELLCQAPETFEAAKFVAYLVGDDLDVYHDLLKNPQLKQNHLVPLSGHPEGIWIEKAKLALDAGYSPEKVAGAAYGYPLSSSSWWGNESAMWAEWVERFDRLCEHEDGRIREVGEAGKAYARANHVRALKEERNEAIYGLDWRRR